MKKAKRRGAGLTAAVTSFAAHVLSGAGPTPQLAIGPLVWGIDPGADTRYWYFVVCSVSEEGQLRLDQLKLAYDNEQAADRCRTALVALLVNRHPAVIALYDDELALAEWCEAVCPGERSRNLRVAIQRERAVP